MKLNIKFNHKRLIPLSLSTLMRDFSSGVNYTESKSTSLGVTRIVYTSLILIIFTNFSNAFVLLSASR